MKAHRPKAALSKVIWRVDLQIIFTGNLCLLSKGVDKQEKMEMLLSLATSDIGIQMLLGPVGQS
jgi:hypothetical protein